MKINLANQISHQELIHSDFQIREVEAVVRRDAFTTIHVHVPPYETNILRNLFGRENVTVFERTSKTTITPTHEYDRLCAKYGHDVVAKVFGEDDGDRLMEIVDGLMAEKPEVGSNSEALETDKAIEEDVKGGKKR
ncbi:MAG: hypothetical protein Q8R65_03465 [Polynucleobacter sp.]|nr:hypothetical protein [Polynucleobacter sp.]MDZ4058141.1 hypothetical protein [Polynucleobacter sp.]